jgi:hypothetical protein
MKGITARLIYDVQIIKTAPFAVQGIFVSSPFALFPISVDRLKTVK